MMTKRGSDKGVVGAARVQGVSRGIPFAAPWMRPDRRRSQRQGADGVVRGNGHACSGLGGFPHVSCSVVVGPGVGAP
eukprot:13518260-Heterocapsa_arctica.AAC.1